MAEWPYSPESGGTTENRAQKGSETPAAISASHLLVQPRWKRRHVITQQDKLPFPKQVVGIYSCHGMEPVYDDDCEDEEDGETDDGGGHSNRELPGDVDDHDESRHSWNFPPPPPISSTVTAVTEGGAAQLQFTPVKPSSSTALASRSTEPEPSSSPTSTSQVRSSTVAKINQDRGGVAFPYGNCRHQALFSVYDGHGQGGELVSQFALSEIQRRLYRHPKFPESVSFVETFLKVDEALKREPLIDPTFAGTTACVVLVKRDKLVVANVGDSRAVVARKIRLSSGLSSGGNEDQSEYAAIPLTEDQNPDVPAEFERITRAGGYVTASPGPGLSARVWLDPSCTQIGLAMSRSIGDHCVSSVGVIAEPVVTHYDLDSSDEFLILASDGVWEFLDSQDAVNVVARSLEERSDDATKACQALIEAAADRWHEEEGEYRDDITAIVVRLQHLWTAEEKATESEGPSSSLSDSPPRKRPRVQDDGKDTSQHVRANEPQQG
jgi:serine/threonine protein phosphatase PrpC